ncbi:hypothetical protein QC763_0048900 [Podospora pseudopauciseta]|uniref:Uncharacterized protein n=2 Tax=Podospora TaxID=5144 RepID=A0ABR0HFF8_9PEZI|nr:hypothetical protein QC763_0048900 [Podospora pseudopauciseta]KAK4677792.1 hypothetical protein QC764_0048520 [Podospora pseudoanserina]
MVISHSLSTLLAGLGCLDFEDTLDGLYRPPDFDNVEPSTGYQLTPSSSDRSAAARHAIMPFLTAGAKVCKIFLAVSAG